LHGSSSSPRCFAFFSNVLGTEFPPGLVFQSRSFLALPGFNSSNFIKVRGGWFWHNLAMRPSIQQRHVVPMWDGKHHSRSAHFFALQEHSLL
jgi:hypothetical protein